MALEVHGDFDVVVHDVEKTVGEAPFEEEEGGDDDGAPNLEGHHVGGLDGGECVLFVEAAEEGEGFGAGEAEGGEDGHGC